MGVHNIHIHIYIINPAQMLSTSPVLAVLVRSTKPAETEQPSAEPSIWPGKFQRSTDGPTLQQCASGQSHETV